MKRTMKLVVNALLFAALLLSLAACGGSSAKVDYPEYYEEVAALLGEKRETVLTKLKLKAEDLTAERYYGLYSTPLKAAYSGIEFEVRLEFDEANDRLNGFWFYKEWQDQRDDAIRDVGTLSKALVGTFGEARTDVDAERFSDMNEEQLKEAFSKASSKDMQVGTDWWQVAKRSDPAVKDYIKDLQEQNTTPLSIADYLNLTLEMKVNASEAASAVGAQLCFRLEVEQTGLAK